MVGGKKSMNPERVVLTESLRATDAERHSTSKSLYGDSAARISSNVYSIHDRARHRAYGLIVDNVRGKTVLHLGCGMGLYTMLMARNLAKQVIGVDASAVVDAARVVASENKLNNITFLRGRLRDVLHQLPKGMKFDVILCEWMGSLLLNESVLTDALYARDHLLAANGYMCPNRSSMHVTAVSDYTFRLDTQDFWSNVYGFTMEPMKELVRREVETCTIPASNIVSGPCLAHTVHMDTLGGLTEEEKQAYEVSAEQAETDRRNKEENPVTHRWVPSAVAQAGFEVPFTLAISQQSTIHYLTFYIDAAYTDKENPGSNFVLGMRPGANNTWTEVSVALREPLPVAAGEKVKGTVKAFTPLDKGGKVTVVQVTAKTEGKVVDIETSGEYFYQSY